MTLPALINKAEQMILKNQFKKTYSILSQALNKSVADLGYIPSCNYILTNTNPSSVSGIIGNSDFADCSALSEAFLKNLNVVQKCKGNGYQKGCIPKYKGFEDILKEKNPELSDEEALEKLNGNGFTSSNILNRNEIYVLADGNIIVPFQPTLSCHLFAVDINGKKKPNKWGYDLFPFWLGNTGKSGLILVGANYDVEKGGKTTRQMIKDMYDDKN